MTTPYDQFEVSEGVTLTLRPQNWMTGEPYYTVSSDRASPNFIAFDYDPIASNSIGFTKAAAQLRFLPQTYQQDNPVLPLRSLLRADIRRWEVTITSGDRVRHFEVNAFTTSNAGVCLHLGAPIDALTFVGRPLDQMV